VTLLVVPLLVGELLGQHFQVRQALANHLDAEASLAFATAEGVFGRYVELGLLAAARALDLFALVPY
jgi:hypothetical protein